MTWTSLKVVIAALILFLGGHAGLFGPALAQSSDARKALVIGNAVYDNLPPVGAATGDALTLAGVLHAAGFDVTQGLNVDRDALRRLLRDFAEDLTAAGPETSGVIYFAGHADSRADAAGNRGGDGGEDGNAAITLLWPVDADPASPEDGIDLDWLMVQLIAAGNTHNSIVIDACHGGSA